jgi:DNA-binding transcriptional MerR regulator
MSKSDRIRRLLARGLSVKEIAKRVKATTNHVHQVKWQADKKKVTAKKAVVKKTVKTNKPLKIIKAVKEMKQALDKIEMKPTKLIIQPQHKNTAMELLAELEKAEKKPQRVMINLARRKDGAIIDLNKNGEVISPPDLVNKPPHYTDGGVDTLNFIEAKDLNYRLGNVVKYISRAGKKVDSDPIQDLEKARFYLEREIEARRDA